MDRETIIRTILAAAIVLGIIWGYNYLVAQRPGEREPPPDQTKQPEKPPAEAPPAEKPPEKPPAEAPPAEKPPEKAPAEAPPAEKPPEKAPAEEPPVAREEPSITAPAEPPAAPPAPKAAALKAVGAAADEAPEPVVIGSALYGASFDLEAEIVARGGGMRRLSVARHRFFKTVEDGYKDDPNVRQALDLVMPDARFAAFVIPEMRVRLEGIDGTLPVDLSEVAWRLHRRDDTTAVAEVDVQTEAGETVLTVRKTYTLTRSGGAGVAAEDRPPVYEVGLRVDLVPPAAPQGPPSAPQGPRATAVQYVLQGPPMLPREDPRQDYRQAVAGMWTEGKLTVAEYAGSKVEGEEKTGPDDLPAMPVPGQRVGWIGQVDKYFTVVAIPGQVSEGAFQAPGDETFAAGATVFQYMSGGAKKEVMAGVRLAVREAPLAGAEGVRHDFLVFAGPKDPKILEKGLYGTLGLGELIIWTRCCDMFAGLLVPLSKLMVFILDALHAVVRNYGVAIIILVLLLRVVLHPVTRWSTKSMAKMQTLGPKMQQLRQQFADDKQRLNQEMMRLYREEGINPVGGCLPMFLQMPIWIALYGALLSAIHLRHAAFIPPEWMPKGWLFLQDLSQPDALVHWEHPIGFTLPFLGAIEFTRFNILPILMAVSMYLQQKLTPQPAAAAGQAGQQKMMMVMMTGMLLVFLYSAPAGLNLYIFTSTILGFFEQRYLKKRYAAAPGGPPRRPGEEAGEPKKPPPPPKKTPYLAAKPRSLAERIRQRIAPAAEKGKKGRK